MLQSNMPQKSSRVIQNLARSLRHNPTDAEAKLWTHLRAHRLRDAHFRRQYPIGNFIVDFCSPRLKLVIELDASHHLDQEFLDTSRTLYLESKGFYILRFWNSDVMNHIDLVLIAIQQSMEEHAIEK
jgi:very-short-patch-repair endonuclease